MSTRLKAVWTVSDMITIGGWVATGQRVTEEKIEIGTIQLGIQFRWNSILVEFGKRRGNSDGLIACTQGVTCSLLLAVCQRSAGRVLGRAVRHPSLLANKMLNLYKSTTRQGD